MKYFFFFDGRKFFLKVNSNFFLVYGGVAGRDFWDTVITRTEF